MRLTRRDAVLALLAGGVGGGTVGLASSSSDPTQTNGPSVLSDSSVQTLVAVAEVVYPSEVTGTEEFARQYVTGLSDRRIGDVASAAEELDDYARRTRGDAYANLSAANRDSVLRAMGVSRTGSSADGSLPERVRYHAVNQLLYGLYTSPKGGKLVGIENPFGYPGGYESYQKPPSSETGPSGAGKIWGGSDE